MTFFTASIIIAITIVVWLLFAGYSWVFYTRNWKQAAKEGAAIALVMFGLMIALAEFK